MPIIMNKITTSQFFILSLLSIWFTWLAFGATTLPQNEVQALKDIAKTLGKKDWNFNGNPCSWNKMEREDGIVDWVKCNCKVPNDSFCHVTKIDLSRNFVMGTIPREWGSSNLLEISLLGNRLTGPIPKELANLTNLTRLILQFNQFSGNLPPELGNLVQIRQMHLSSNNFTGELPATFARLTTMKELYIQGSGLSGPIPSGIFSLLNLTELRISDLNGADSTFPQVDNMKELKVLILRSCNINDTFPQYLANLISLQTLYLTGNFFTGPVPEWTEANKNLNLFASFSRNNLGPVSCESNTRICSKNVKSLHINCGGKQAIIGGITYDEDIDPAGASVYRQSTNNWALSNTGHFMDNNTRTKPLPYTTENETRLYMPDMELYKNARISPMSLTYYGFCLENGDYTVKLHFAEIMFTNDNTYSSLGRRLFDVYIQGERVLKDFNIANEAQGVGKELIKEFPAHVSSNDLEIRFYWAGRGTTYIPYKSINGPLISAISVKHDSIGGISAGAIVAIVVAALIVIILIVIGILWWGGCLGKKRLLELRDLDLQTSLFTLHQIKEATNNFDISNKIGQGGFGSVYKGTLSNGTKIAVKQLSSKSKQGNREFVNEIGMISPMQHPFLIKLYGCCVEGDQLFLVYEYMENNSLAHALFGSEGRHLKLNWPTRQKICVGIARGLTFLHEESRLKVVHRDLKTSNVLLDENLNPKISDFGLARLDEGDNTHISTRIAGTYGYMAPEYALHGYLTDKADVYSFGIVALEIVSGRKNSVHWENGEAFYLLDWARLLKEKGNLLELVDPRLGSDFNEEEVMTMVKVALLCTNVTSNLRPSMSSVLSMLEGKTMVSEIVSHPSEVMDEMKLELMRQYYSQMEENKTSEARSLILTIDVPWTASSSSAVNLNQGHLDASYLKKKKIRESV
ncbi:hypothetical protein VNO77_28110 [Canavalia gladiata]|uniref:non-specific serine/threonine protein kinase n=1 Tax=Canavalia gladiata TaxID=3824 RepID=A0AAN9KVT3_CANGL